MPSRTIDAPFSLSIGGAGIRISPDTSFIFPDSANCYDGFITSHAAGNPEVSIEISLKKSPDTGEMEILFDADDAWSLRSNSAGSYFVGHGPAWLNDPPWVIKFNESSGSAVVYANPEITGDGGLPVCPVHYPVDQLICVNALAGCGGVIIHCAGIELGGRVFLFPGRSGAGKSTLSRGFAAGGGGRVLSDDRMIVRKQETGFAAYGTPWPGDAGYAVNEGGRLGGIFFLQHGKTNSVKHICAAESAERLLQVSSVPWYDAGRCRAVMDTIGELVGSVDCAVLDFVPDGGLAGFISDITCERVSA